MLQQRRSRVLLVLIVLFVSAVALPQMAFAGFLVPPGDYQPGEPSTKPAFSTLTNPSIAQDWWRYSWGNSAYPDLNIAVPTGYQLLSGASDESTYVVGVMYRLDRNPFLTFWPQDPGFDQSSVDYIWNYEEVTGRVHTAYDVQGTYDSDPLVMGPNLPGTRLPTEGIWFIHWAFIYEDKSVDVTSSISPFGYDVTPPLPVAKITAKPFIDYLGPTSNVWFPDSRAVVAWEDKEYDALAGIGAYEVALNDEVLPGYVFHTDFAFTQKTIENLPPGKNKITVTSVDRATNRGPAVATYFYSDPDVPKIAITSPVDNGLVPRNSVFAANATDGAGIQFVQFYIDGVLVGSDTTAPYSLSKDMAGYANGTHTLLVKTKDMYGREVTDSTNFTLDKTPPTISSITDSPDPFFPVITDAYKDFSYVNFWVSEKVSAYLYVYTASGNVFAVRSAPRGPGWTGLTWDGKGYGGQTGIGTFRYRVMAQDSAGNQTWSGLYSTTIRDFELVRVAPNAVRVVPR